MPVGLKRIQECGDLHFVTFSCYGRRPYFSNSGAKEIFERSLEKVRRQYCFAVIGYVVMPEHVHLLVSEPAGVLLARALQAVKVSVSIQTERRPFWDRRYYDFNVYTSGKRFEKLKYMHRNPVARGLVKEPEAWVWSSCQYYASGLSGTVWIEPKEKIPGFVG